MIVQSLVVRGNRRIFLSCMRWKPAHIYSGAPIFREHLSAVRSWAPVQMQVDFTHVGSASIVEGAEASFLLMDGEMHTATRIASPVPDHSPGPLHFYIADTPFRVDPREVMGAADLLTGCRRFLRDGRLEPPAGWTWGPSWELEERELYPPG